MYIKMTDDKSLVVTIPTTIYRGENNADMVTFLIPSEYQGKNVADCAVALRYVTPDGTGRSEALVYQPETYKNYLQYSNLVSTRLTADEGNVCAWLTCFDSDDNVLFKTGEVIIPVHPSKNIVDYMPPEDLDQLDQLALRMDELEEKQVDDLSLDAVSGELTLKANGASVGTAVNLKETIEDVTDDIVEEAVGEAVEEADDPIYFGRTTAGDGKQAASDDVTYF